MTRLLNIFFHTAGPNTALVKSSGSKDVKIVIGGRMLAFPIIQRVDRLGLELRTITVHTTRGTTINGVSVDVTSCCQVKIQSWSSARTHAQNVDQNEDNYPGQEHVGGGLHIDYSAVRLAAQHFIGKTDADIERSIQKTVAGHQRAIIGGLTVEDLYKNREMFSKRVLDLCTDDMRNMGLTIVSYTVAEITDDQGYIEALGVTQTELVKRTALEGQANHQGKAKSKKALEEANAHLLVNHELERKIESDKRRVIAQAEAQREVDRQTAIQEKAKAISTAEQNAVLLVAEKKAKAAEAQAELKVMQQCVEREKLLQEQKVHVAADAQLYQAQVEAEGIKATANAEAEKIRMMGEASADSNASHVRKRGLAEADAAAETVRQNGLAEAEVIRTKGLAKVEVEKAEAEAIRAKGMAECDILRLRLELWKESGNQGIILEKIIEILPQVAAAVAGPLAQTEKMVFVGSGSGGGGGPSQFTREMNRIVAEVPETIHALTGCDMTEGLGSYLKSGNA